MPWYSLLFSLLPAVHGSTPDEMNLVLHPRPSPFGSASWRLALTCPVGQSDGGHVA